MRVILLSIVFFLVQQAILISKPNLAVKAVNSINWDKVPYFPHYSSASQRIILSNLATLNKAIDNRVYILGGSASREFFLPDREISKDLGIDVINLSSANQSLFDSMRLIDNVQGENITIIYTILPIKILWPEEKKLNKTKKFMGNNLIYPIQSSAIDSLKCEDVLILGENIFKPLNFTVGLFKRQARTCFKWLVDLPKFSKWAFLFETSNEYDRYKYEYSLPIIKMKKLLLNINRTKGDDFKKNLKYNMSILSKIKHLTDERQINFVLLELPISKMTKEYFSEEVVYYKKYIKKYCRELELPFYRLSGHFKNDQTFTEEYFADTCHLLPEGRAKFKEYSYYGIKYASRRNIRK